MNTRSTQAIIHTDHLLHNYKSYQEETGLNIFAVVKANAYGHDDILVSKALEDEVDVFCVSSLDEAIHLHHAGIRKDILVFSYVDVEMIKKYHRNNFIYTILSNEWYQSLRTLNKNIRTHIKVDTGMNRVGIKDIEEIKEILSLNDLNIEGIYTHFSSSDDDQQETLKQLNLFEEILKTLDHSFKWIHTSNTHASSYVKSDIINAMRLGIGLYGYEKDNPKLKQVMELTTSVIHLFDADEDETIGYNQTFKLTKNSKIATLPIGYADGLDQRFKYVYINNKKYPIVGKICMDQCMVLVDASVKMHDSVELLGENQSYAEIFKDTGINPYIMMSTLMKRIKRIEKVSTSD